MRDPVPELHSRVLGRALDTFRGEWPLLLSVALVALLPAAFVQALLSLSRDASSADGAIVVLTLAQVAVGAFGYFFFCGVVAQVALAVRGQRERPRLGEVLRTLPYGHLIFADAVLTAGIAVGFELLVIPGILFGTVFWFAPALIELQHLRAGEALRLSRSLVRGRFWQVAGLLLVTIGATAGLAELIDLAAEAVLGTNRLPEKVLATLLTSLAIKPATAIVTVEMALELLADDGGADDHGRQARRAPGRRARCARSRQ